MGLFATIFGSSKAVEEVAKTTNTIFDHAGKFIDNMAYTPEEKAEMNLSLHQSRMKMLEMAHQYNSDGKSLTRRLIVVGFAGSYLLFLWISGILEVFEIEQADIFALLVDKLEWHVTLCFYFYFGYYGIKQVGTGMLKSYTWLRAQRKIPTGRPSTVP